jgi:phage terminase small subunit
LSVKQREQVKGGLSPKQEQFCRQYLVDLNATQAAIRSGYSKKTANEQGSRLLANVNVSARIAELRTEQAKRLDITADRVLTEFGKLAFSNLMDYFEVQPDGSAVIDLSALTPDQAAALQEITVDEYTEGSGKAARQVKKVRIKLGDKKGALDSLAKHLGMFTNKEFNPNTGGSTLAELLAAYAPLRK